MTRFKIYVEHNNLTQCYLIVEQADQIFIAFPQKNASKERVFLTRDNGKWSGDLEDKKLLTKMTNEIDQLI